MYVELRAPWYLYDDTPATAQLLRAHSRGVLPLAGEGRDWPPEMLGELALAYLNGRLDERLAAAAEEAVQRSGDPVVRALVEAERDLFEDRATPRTLALLDGAVRLDPHAWAPRWSRGWLLNSTGRYEDALADLDVALAERPGHLLVRHQRMKSLALLQRMKEAYDECTALLGSPLVETEPRLWAEGAFFSAGFGRMEEAVQRMTRYLELEPYSPQEWEMLAGWYEQLDRPADRALALENSELARRNVVRDYLWLARWHEQYGTPEEAAMALEALLELEPDDPAVLRELERLRG
jgi:tetratricopeptide (TPR) repeat protein